MTKFHVLIPAAGVGNRMATVIPKQYLPLAGKPMISHSIQTFFANPRIDTITLALNPDDEFWHSLNLDAASKLKLQYTGGDTRSATVLNTLAVLRHIVADDDWILVHDAARPGLSAQLLNNLLVSLEHDEVGGLLALPLADTLKQSQADARSANTIPRDGLWQAQTPQMFRYALLKKALESFEGAPTDEAQAVENLGLQPKLVVGHLRNMKVTYPHDMAVVEALMQQEQT